MLELFRNMTLEDTRNIATVVGSLGTLSAMLWAVYVYRRNRIDEEAAKFRINIVELVNQFQETMDVFEDNIVAIGKKLFDPANPATDRIFAMVLEILDKSKTEDQCKQKVNAIERELNEWVLYALDPDDLARANAPRFRSFTLLQSIRAFLPVMYEFINTITELVFTIHRTELAVGRIRRYTIKTIPDLWRLKKDGESIASVEELQRAWRNIVAVYMNQKSNDVSFGKIFNAAGELSSEYTTLYLEANNKGLWRFHKSERKKNLDDFQAETRSEKLSAIVLWKVGRKNPEILAKLIRLVTNFEQVVS